MSSLLNAVFFPVYQGYITELGTFECSNPMLCPIALVAIHRKLCPLVELTVNSLASLKKISPDSPDEGENST